MVYAQQLLADEARKLYGNAGITLSQAAAYANTPEKQLLCYRGLNMLFMQHVPRLDSLTRYELNKRLRAAFPRLNHREQA